MIINIRHSLIVFLLLFGAYQTTISAEVVSKPDTIKPVRFHFRTGSSALERGYMANRESLDALDAILLRSAFIEKTDSLIVSAGASPDGNWDHNKQLAQGRAEAIKAYIAELTPSLDRDKIKAYSSVTSWSELIPLIEADTASPYKTAILAVLSTHTTPTATESQLRRLHSGKAWQYITTHYLPQFRSGDASIVFYYEGKSVTLDEAVAQEITPTAEVVLPEEVVVDSLPTLVEVELPVEVAPKDTLPEPVQIPAPVEITPAERRPLLAVKTNLLFDAASLLNIEVEVPIGRRFSVAGEWIFPWWLWEKKQVCLQVLSGNIEGRYWFGERENRLQLTGWFAGFYMGAGLYDLEWKTKGYQGEFFIAAGLSGGYAHTINKSGTLRMEYSLGLGYMQTKYREYIPFNGGEILAWQKDGRYSWLGPTRAKVSLVWMINHKSKRGGIK